MSSLCSFLVSVSAETGVWMEVGSGFVCVLFWSFAASWACPKRSPAEPRAERLGRSEGEAHDTAAAGPVAYGIGFTVDGVSVAGSRLGDASLNVSISAIVQLKVAQGFILPSMGSIRAS